MKVSKAGRYACSVLRGELVCAEFSRSKCAAHEDGTKSVRGAKRREPAIFAIFVHSSKGRSRFSLLARFSRIFAMYQARAHRSRKVSKDCTRGGAAIYDTFGIFERDQCVIAQMPSRQFRCLSGPFHKWRRGYDALLVEGRELFVITSWRNGGRDARSSAQSLYVPRRFLARGTQQRAPTDRGGSDRAAVPVGAGVRAASIAEQPRGREGRGTVGSAGPALAKPLGGG
jgi:hypothetical protein